MALSHYSIILAIGAGNGLLSAALLLSLPANRVANRYLATLLLLVVLRVTMYVVGYAGAYDTWPWLTFFPFDWSLAFGPLIWVYVVTLTSGTSPRGLVVHSLPVVVQVLYAAVCFCLPMDLKWNWYTGGDRHLIAPLFQLFGIVQLGAYVLFAYRAYLRYDLWLQDRFSNVEARRALWLRWSISAFGIYWLISTSCTFWSWWVSPLDFFQRFPLMIAFCALVYTLGLLSWRYGGLVA